MFVTIGLVILDALLDTSMFYRYLIAGLYIALLSRIIHRAKFNRTLNFCHIQDMCVAKHNFSFQTALSMTEYLMKEEEFIPWVSAIDAFRVKFVSSVTDKDKINHVSLK